MKIIKKYCKGCRYKGFFRRCKVLPFKQEWIISEDNKSKTLIDCNLFYKKKVKWFQYE